jgi:hypothetical protein
MTERQVGLVWAPLSITMGKAGLLTARPDHNAWDATYQEPQGGEWSGQLAREGGGGAAVAGDDQVQNNRPSRVPPDRQER